jgi:hypothetical protein
MMGSYAAGWHRGLVVLVAAVLSNGTNPVCAQDTELGGEGAREADSLDQQLLDSLEGDLLKGLPKLPEPSPPQASPRDDRADPAGGGDQSLRQTSGEDLGQETDDPLQSIGRRMRRAEDLLAQRETAESTQALQREILDDLQRMIERLQQQCQGGQNSNSPSPAGKPSQKPGQANRQGSGENSGTNKPSPDSTERVGAANRDGAEWERMQRALKQVWGHLPERVRQQMQSGMGEEFLPKYEDLIGQYYLRLAEDAE